MKVFFLFFLVTFRGLFLIWLHFNLSVCTKCRQFAHPKDNKLYPPTFEGMLFNRKFNIKALLSIDQADINRGTMANKSGRHNLFGGPQNPKWFKRKLPANMLCLPRLAQKLLDWFCTKVHKTCILG